ncbi:SDR family NAD(P)-dependent oxidoreductase [Gemmatimonadota bacterium]
MDFTGKTCIVTGANTGLGFEVATRLAIRGADITLLCRSRRRGEEAVLKIQETHPGALVELAVCDLSSLSSVQGFVHGFKEKRSKLDLLYNNAAVMKSERTETEDGFELMFQVNYLAPFLLMTSLLDLLRKGTSPFLINNGRPSYKLRLDLDDLQFTKKYRMYQSFFLTKLCLLLSTLELARRPECDGVTVTMIDPGPFKSELVRDNRVAGWVKNLFSAPVEKAAENILFHLNPDEAKKKHGKVFKETKDHPLSDYWTDPATSGRLWSMTEEMLKGAMH